MQIEKKYVNGPMNALLLSVLPLVLAFAGLLPSNPAATQQAITPENHQAAATAEQERKQGAEGILATITQSRSTNSRGYKVVIHNVPQGFQRLEPRGFLGRMQTLAFFDRGRQGVVAGPDLCTSPRAVPHAPEARESPQRHNHHRPLATRGQ